MRFGSLTREVATTGLFDKGLASPRFRLRACSRTAYLNKTRVIETCSEIDSFRWQRLHQTQGYVHSSARLPRLLGHGLSILQCPDYRKQRALRRSAQTCFF